ncbi:TlpA family protein disulfide reductase [Flagellimonas lutaonensis]|uniref:Alkyl hydroperoxide reductase/ Thiol specific antioxidant/ Mal allergen n=1 Tax=Flagellimonas lutaonensis TaxID=516051 RepID=A0A0D5YXE1_9FLAO|nr:DUF4369 domain-containing protein [Allomuricauda lutaonensis]AKA36534.1 Alkyl hydroperoxide reductase/ Thiol specific antioxidant/ Mal allergen [Allomuricauda lutaonensis]
MIRVLLGISLLAVFSCSEKGPGSTTVYFAGEIVNPTSDYVVLFRNENVLDSAKLDENNRFSFTLDKIQEGMHHFEHSPEWQYIYFEEGDSIRIRLNTVEFDESLVFSGNGSEINNFLVELFLAHEDDERLIYSFYELEPEAFKNKMDSLRQTKLDLLQQVQEESLISEKASQMARAAIDYNNFIYREEYPFYHRKKAREIEVHELDKDFYGYRNAVNLNDKELAYFKPYYHYVKNYLGNLTYMACSKNCGMEKLKSKDHLHYNKHKLYLVDSLITEEELRNNLFRNVAMDYLLKEHKSNEDCDKFIQKFTKLSTNDEHIAEINDLYQGIQRLQPFSSVPNVTVANTTGEQIALKDISKGQKTAFYFWTGTQKGHLRNVNRQIAKLKQQHPEYRFVGINIKTSHDQWLQLMSEHKLDTLNQYRSDDFEAIQKGLILDNLNKCVITHDTVIVDAFANVFYSF